MALQHLFLINKIVFFFLSFFILLWFTLSIFFFLSQSFTFQTFCCRSCFPDFSIEEKTCSARLLIHCYSRAWTTKGLWEKLEPCIAVKALCIRNIIFKNAQNYIKCFKRKHYCITDWCITIELKRYNEKQTTFTPIFRRQVIQ